MPHDLWQTDPDGMLASEEDDVRMTVQKFSDCARYLVYRKLSNNKTQPYLLLGSGTQGTVQDAMKAAMKLAARLAASILSSEPQPSAIAN